MNQELSSMIDKNIKRSIFFVALATSLLLSGCDKIIEKLGEEYNSSVPPEIECKCLLPPEGSTFDAHIPGVWVNVDQ